MQMRAVCVNTSGKYGLHHSQYMIQIMNALVLLHIRSDVCLQFSPPKPNAYQITRVAEGCFFSSFLLCKNHWGQGSITRGERWILGFILCLLNKSLSGAAISHLVVKGIS